MMMTKVIRLFVLVLVSQVSLFAVDSDKSGYEAAITPAKNAAENAAAAYAAAQKAVTENRQLATEAKKKADGLIANQQKRAETKVAAAAKAHTDVTNAKASKDKALADINTAVTKAQQANTVAEKALQDAEAVAKTKAETVNNLANGADKATATAAAKLKSVVDTSTALTKAQKDEDAASTNAAATAQKHSESIAHKKLVDQILENINKQKASTDEAIRAKAEKDEKHAKALAATAAEKLKETEAFKVAAEAALANANKQVASAIQENHAAKEAANDIIRLKQENQQAAVHVVAKRKESDAAKAVLAQAIKNQEEAQRQVKAAEEKVAQSAEKKSNEEELAKIKYQVAAEMAAHKAAEKAANDAEGDVAKAKTAVDKTQEDLTAAKKASVDLLPPIERASAKYEEAEKAAAAAEKAVAPLMEAMQKADKAYGEVEKEADAKRKQANTAKKLAGPSAAEDLKQAETAVATAVKTLENAEKAKPPLDQALTDARNATRPLQEAYDAADKEARKAEAEARVAFDTAYKLANEAKKAAAQAAAKRRAATDSKRSVDIAAELADVETFEKIAEEKKQAAAEADKKRKEAGSELFKLDEASKLAAEEAIAKRAAANKAANDLKPKAKTLEQALTDASKAKDNLERAQKQKKTAKDALENLKKRIASAKETHEADEKAAQEAEARAAPLMAEAEKTRAAYEASNNVASEKRSLAQQAKATLYQLLSAKRMPSLMDSPDSPKPGNKIDELVFKKLNSMGIEPVLCSDAVFVRRAYLDLTGSLPAAEEAKTFILDKDHAKRTALIDRLLEKTAHFDYWAMRWSDILRIKAEFPVKLWPNGAQAYHRWVWESIAQNKPYDKFIREMLTSSGSNFRVGSVNFYRAIQDQTPGGIAASVGLALMGTRVYLWPEDRRANMAVFFSQVGYKPTSEWKEEIVFWDPLGSAKIPGCTAPGDKDVAEAVKITNKIPQELPEPMSPNGPLEAVFPDGTKTTIPPNLDPREVFADWLIRPENPWFARAIVNRTWAWAMGRGIIHEPDDIRNDNPPSNPELLAYLEKELVSSGYDLKHLKRLIFSSTTYQFSSIPRFKTPKASANFASYMLRRVEAEVLIDAVNQITGSSDLYTSAVPEPFTYIPKHMSAVELADGSITSSFLMLFGRSARDTGMENERISELASRQWLHMLNSATIQEKLKSGQKLKRLLSIGGKPNEVAERLYLTILSRFPTEADIKAAEEYAKSGVAKGQDAWVDLAWALINNPEFLLRH